MQVQVHTHIHTRTNARARVRAHTLPLTTESDRMRNHNRHTRIATVKCDPPEHLDRQPVLICSFLYFSPLKLPKIREKLDVSQHSLIICMRVGVCCVFVDNNLHAIF